MESRKIFNRGSMFEDHTRYWENLDGFVLRVIRECARTAESSWKDLLPPQSPQIDERAEWRIRYLRILRWAAGAFWLPILAMLWIRWGEQIWIPEDAARWLPAAAVIWLRFSILAVAVVFSARLVGGVLQLPWKWWTRSEQKKFLGGAEVSGTPWFALVGMGAFAWAFLMLVWRAVFPDWTPNKGVEEFLMLSLGASLFSILLLRLFLRPPAAAKTADAQP